MLEKPKTAKAMYEELVPARAPYLRRGRECAELTIPSMLPPEGQEGQDLPTPWQSVGAQGVNNLASKVLMALFPAGTPFFKFGMDQKTKAAVKANGPEVMSEVEQTLSELEGRVMDEIEDKADRVTAFEVLKHLVVVGNMLAYCPPSGTMRCFKLNQYVVKLDRSGNIIRIVIKESISPLALSGPLAEAAKIEAERNKRSDGSVEIYTVIERHSREHYRTWQEVCDEPVTETAGWLMADALPYMALGWARVDGEDYARSHVEEYLGDFNSLDGLSKSVTEGAAASAKIVYLRNPGSATTAKQFSEAENGDCIDGTEADFKVVQANKFADMKVAEMQIARLELRLAKAFLLTSSIQRQAERVTAEEIRIMAGELEDALGGIYSRLTLEFQLPYVRRKMALMQQQGKLPHFPKGTMVPTIVTGMAALGRNHKVAKIMSWARACTEMIGPEAFAESIETDVLLKTFGTGFGVEVNEIVKSAAKLQAERQQKAQQQTVQALGPDVIKAQAQRQSQQ